MVVRVEGAEVEGVAVVEEDVVEGGVVVDDIDEVSI